MIANNNDKSVDPLLAKVEPALHRAAKRAREIAARTNTHLVIYEDGETKLIKVTLDDIRRDSSAT